MQLLTQSADNCLLYAAAMVLDTTPEALIALIGHDGTEIWWPNQVGAKKQRAFHPQEILDAAAISGKTLICIEFMPRSGWTNDDSKLIFNTDKMCARFEAWLKGRAAILIVNSHNMGHAVAWNGEAVYDPKGCIASIGDYEIQEAWVLTELI